MKNNVIASISLTSVAMVKSGGMRPREENHFSCLSRLHRWCHFDKLLKVESISHFSSSFVCQVCYAKHNGRGSKEGGTKGFRHKGEGFVDETCCRHDDAWKVLESSRSHPVFFLVLLILFPGVWHWKPTKKSGPDYRKKKKLIRHSYQRRTKTFLSHPPHGKRPLGETRF